MNNTDTDQQNRESDRNHRRHLENGRHSDTDRPNDGCQDDRPDDPDDSDPWMKFIHRLASRVRFRELIDMPGSTGGGGISLSIGSDRLVDDLTESVGRFGIRRTDIPAIFGDSVDHIDSTLSRQQTSSVLFVDARVKTDESFDRAAG